MASQFDLSQSTFIGNRYANNIHARLDNILTDVYFGTMNNTSQRAWPTERQSTAVPKLFGSPATAARNAIMPTTMIPPNTTDSYYTIVIWVIIGVVVGFSICYIILCSDTMFGEQRKRQNRATQRGSAVEGNYTTDEEVAELVLTTRNPFSKKLR